jgi:diadenosine tetraphosphate (Ap4A) HIT family hydrolase
VSECALCQGPGSDAELNRVEVWSDELWRLSTSVGPGDPTLGFSYLEPKRHVPHIEDLDGAEAATFGAVIARCCRALKDATGAELVYVYVFGGGIPHLHVHLAPHTEGDALNDALLKGELELQPCRAAPPPTSARTTRRCPPRSASPSPSGSGRSSRVDAARCARTRPPGATMSGNAG